MNRRYAYRHRKNGKFGLLEAVNYADAKRHLGNGYRIKAVDLTDAQVIAAMYSRDVMHEIVEKALA